MLHKLLLTAFTAGHAVSSHDSRLLRQGAPVVIARKHKLFFSFLSSYHVFCVTGEHTVVMLHPLQSQLVEGTAWLDPFVQDFRTRFLTLLSGAFRGFAPALALTILDPQLTFTEAQVETGVSEGGAIRKADGSPMSAYDLKRLQVWVCRLQTA